MPKLIEPIAADEVDIAFGSRALDRQLIGHHQPWRREQAGRVFQSSRAARDRLAVLGHAMRIQGFSSRCLPADSRSRAHRRFRLRRGIALSRAASRTADARDSGALESSRRKQDSRRARQPAHAARSSFAASRRECERASSRCEPDACQNRSSIRRRSDSDERLYHRSSIISLTISAFSSMRRRRCSPSCLSG